MAEASSVLLPRARFRSHRSDSGDSPKRPWRSRATAQSGTTASPTIDQSERTNPFPTATTPCAARTPAIRFQLADYGTQSSQPARMRFAATHHGPATPQVTAPMTASAAHEASDAGSPTEERESTMVALRALNPALCALLEIEDADMTIAQRTSLSWKIVAATHYGPATPQVTAPMTAPAAHEASDAGSPTEERESTMAYSLVALRALDPALCALLEMEEDDMTIPQRRSLSWKIGYGRSCHTTTERAKLVIPEATVLEDSVTSDASPRPTKPASRAAQPLCKPQATVEASEWRSDSDSEEEWQPSTSRARIRTARSVSQASAETMLDRAKRRKWRPPDALYGNDDSHVQRRKFAEQELAKMPWHKSAVGKKRLRDENKLLKSEGERLQEKRFAALLLCEIIPPEAAKLLGGGVIRAPQFVLNDILTAIGNLSPGGIITCTDSFLRFEAWTRKYHYSLSSLTIWHAKQYLQYVHANAVSTPGTQQEIDDGLADVQVDLDSDSDADDESDIVRHAAKGVHAARSQRANLVRLELNMEFPLHMTRAQVPVWEGGPLPPVKHAQPLDPWDMHKLGKYIEDPNTSEILANIAGSYYASAVAIARSKQMQHMSLENEGNDSASIAFGTARYAKDPLHRGKSERMIFVKHGFHGSTLWLKRWRSTLRDVRAGLFSYRDFVGSDPRKATQFENCAMPSGKIRTTLRIVLQDACGMSPAKASMYSYHGARHFVTTCSRFRKEPVDRQLELGAWCGSDIALIGQTPQEAKRRLLDIHNRQTPDRYASEAALRNAAQIIEGNCQAVVELLTRFPLKPSDVEDDGFNLLAPYSSSTGGT